MRSNITNKTQAEDPVAAALANYRGKKRKQPAAAPLPTHAVKYYEKRMQLGNKTYVAYLPTLVSLNQTPFPAELLRQRTTWDDDSKVRNAREKGDKSFALG